MLWAMELRSLEYFVAVADERSFTRAAQLCHVTQSTISAQISGLEKQLGEPLFDRSGREVGLTEGGQVLLPYARRCLAAAADARAEFSARAGLERGELRIGTGGGVEHTAIPELLGRLHRERPGIDIHLVEATSGPLLDLLLQGRLHAAVIARPVEALPPTVTAAPLFTGRLVAAFDPAVYRLDEPVSLAELAGHPVISYPTTSALRTRLDAAARDQGVTLAVNYVANDVRLQTAFAREGVGVAVSLGADPALGDLRGLAVRSISPAVPIEKILVWRTDIVACAPLRAFLALWNEWSTDDERRSA
ncbi:LysR family transcriptional regulator [Nakamurella flava]|uniref:LysR family transcriptional regulator n=2 Tax=Nakamurella flava TaxID=2576308 RepID=A0A4U6QKG4_9ACTN|nr:LysR family transcriptional regulator [Nakamurella flava]